MSFPARATAMFAALAALSIVAGCTVSTETAQCLANLGWITEEDVIYADDEFVVLAVWDGEPDHCPTDFNWSATGPVELLGTTGSSITARALGPGSATVRLTAGGGFEVSNSLDFRRITGDIGLNFDGLPMGLGGRIDLRGPNGFSQTLTGETVLHDVEAGDWEYDVHEVTGGPLSHRYGGIDLSGSFQLDRDESLSLSIPYKRLTAQLDLVSNLPDGFTGAIGEINNASTYNVTSTPLSLAIEPGLHAWNAFSVDPDGYDFQPEVASGSFDAVEGGTVELDWKFTASRGLLETAVTGLPEGASVEANLSGPDNLMPTLPGMTYLSPGSYELEVPAVEVENEQTDRTEKYETTPSIRPFDILAGLPFLITVSFILVAWTAYFLATSGVLSDPFGHAGFILLASQLTLYVVWNASAAIGGDVAADGAAAAVEAGTITISGPAPWVTVTGPIDENGDFVATGSGTVAGYPDVPVTFTGQLTDEKTLTGTLQMGSDTPPTGLPGGAITYSITASSVEIVSGNVGVARGSP